MFIKWHFSYYLNYMPKTARAILQMPPATVAAIEKLGAEGELEAPEAIAVVRKQIKQRRDSVESFAANNRPELAEKELAEIAVLERFLPAAMSAEEIEALTQSVISETGATGKADMGKVMKVLQERTAGRADGKTLSQTVSRLLA